MERVTALRKKLHEYHLNTNTNTPKMKDLLFLDIALEQYVKTLADRIIHIDIGFGAYMREVGILLDHLSLNSTWSEPRSVREDWYKLAM